MTPFSGNDQYFVGLQGDHAGSGLEVQVLLALDEEGSGPFPPPPPANPAAFVPVSVVSARSVGRMDILLPNGFRIRVSPRVDGQALAEVLAVLT